MGEAKPLSAALTCLTGLRSARAKFFAALVDYAGKHAPEECRDPDGGLAREYLNLIRSESAAQIAELFFVIEELGLRDGKRFRSYLVNHNAAMDAYLADPAQARLLGLSQQRIKSSRFPEERLGFFEMVSPPGQLYLDQAAVGRLLAEVMAPETSRKVVIALAEGNLLQRHSHGTVLISSEGVLEGLYRDHLNFVVDTVRNYE